jgi:hypothetical protein
MHINRSDTAVVFINPQNEVLNESMSSGAISAVS